MGVIKSFLLTRRKQTQFQHRYRFRLLSEYMGFPKRSWPLALEKLLGMGEGRARTVIKRFTPWIRAKYRLAPRSCVRWAGMHSFLEHANQKGAIPWRFKTHGEYRIEKEMLGVSASYRRHLGGFLKSLAGSARSTIINRRCALLRFGQYVKRHRLDHITMTYSQGCDWADDFIQNSGFQPQTQKSQFQAVRLFYRWLWRHEYVRRSNFEHVGRQVKAVKRVPVVLTEPEVRRLIRTAWTPRNRAMVELLYASGCRIGELKSIDLERVHWGTRTIVCQAKSHKERILHFGRAAEEALREYLPHRSKVLESRGTQGEPALFVNQYGSRLGIVAVQHLFNELRRRAGLGRRVTPHVLRHSFATHLLNRGVDILSLQRLMGHKCIASTLIYIETARVPLTKIYNKYHPRA
jgi:site-specific recombinase XerD